MRYRNIKTGAVIDSPCPISGEFWTLYREPATEAQEAPKPVDTVDTVEEARGDDGVVTLSKMTVAALKAFAADCGIDLGGTNKKADIIEVIMASDAVEVE
ncbi:MAG: hypothetical protein GX900_06495 [Clostridiaceae bacterium]|jgi:hypothetical protein|nr:hypothetical protein [Clostridiaceae bacterium]